MNYRLFKKRIVALYIVMNTCIGSLYALDTMFDSAVKVQRKYEKEKAQLKQQKQQQEAKPVVSAPAVPKQEKVSPIIVETRRKKKEWRKFPKRYHNHRKENPASRGADSSGEKLSLWDRFWGTKSQKVEKPVSKEISKILESYNFCNVKVELMFGDIAAQSDVDAIVNAANPQLSGGDGVTGAIWKAAGPELDEYIKMIPAYKDGVRLETGMASWTPGFNLKATRIIHAVGPRGDNPNRQELLKSVYRNILDLYFSDNWLMKSYFPRKGHSNPFLPWTGGHDYKTIAIPMISTGIYEYPREEATQIAVDEIIKWAGQNPEKVLTIRFVFFNDENGRESYELYKKFLGQACSSLPSQTK